MKKIIVFIISLVIISSFASADRMPETIFSHIQLVQLDDVINENTEDDSDGNEGENNDVNQNNEEKSTEPKEFMQEDKTESSEDNQNEEPIETEEPITETSKPTETPIEDNKPLEPEKKIHPKPAPSIINSLNKENAWSNKTVYLTFDDGPSSLTNKVLDLLKKEEIKATFFVIGTKTEEGKTLLKRIAKEGHALGNHTYSHNYNYIYSNVDNFFDDLYKNENIIYEASGKRPKIIRFPGGSNNAATKTEKGKKVINEIMDRLEKEGYLHFDWNASSGDASAVSASVDQIINNTLTWISRKDTAVVLFHDTAAKTNTLKALPIIIDKLKFLGCKFEILTTSSPHIAFVKNSNSNGAVPASTNTTSNDTNNRGRKPPYVIKKLMKLDMEMEERFLENGH